MPFEDDMLKHHGIIGMKRDIRRARAGLSKSSWDSVKKEIKDFYKTKRELSSDNKAKAKFKQYIHLVRKARNASPEAKKNAKNLFKTKADSANASERFMISSMLGSQGLSRKQLKNGIFSKLQGRHIKKATYRMLDVKDKHELFTKLSKDKNLSTKDRKEASSMT